MAVAAAAAHAQASDVQDPPFGIHLCGKDLCVLPDGPIKPVHDERVRPYRGIPIFNAQTIVQHYLTPEEMMPFHKQASPVVQCGHTIFLQQSSIDRTNVLLCLSFTNLMSKQRFAAA